MTQRSLWPREHGAYFQLALPLATALVRTPSMSTFALGAGAISAFLANEPLLVVLGHRGARRKATDGGRARRRLGILVVSAFFLGALGLMLAPTAVTAAAIVGIPAVALLGFAWRRAEHTLAGELVAAIALTGASAPLLVASGASLSVAIEVWLAWAIGFGASVIAVHRVIARHKRAASQIDRVLPFVMLAIVAAGLATGCSAFAIAEPLVVLAAGIVIVPPPARRLRAIGVAIVVAAVATSAVILLR